MARRKTVWMVKDRYGEWLMPYTGDLRRKEKALLGPFVCHKGLLKVAIACGWRKEVRKAQRIRVHWHDNPRGECLIGFGGPYHSPFLHLDFMDKHIELSSSLVEPLFGIDKWADDAEPDRRGDLWVEMEWEEE